MNEREQRNLIEDYLRRLDAALGDVPNPARRELIEDVRGHIAEAWDNAPERNRATLLNILERLGAPEEMAREERERLGIKPVDEGRHEMLSWAAIVFTVLFWPVGVILAWLSSRWTMGDKAIATALPLLGLVLMLSLSVATFTTVTRGEARQVVVNAESAAPAPAAPAQAPWQGVAWRDVGVRALAFYGLLGAPWTAAAYLALRLRQRSRAGRVMMSVVVGSLLLIGLVLALSTPTRFTPSLMIQTTQAVEVQIEAQQVR
ncbi:MAG: HAAS signaling domain-containing protein [Chloroflexota bacterium]